jgi:hypothetical protein
VNAIQCYIIFKIKKKNITLCNAVRDAKYFLLRLIDVMLVEWQHIGVENRYEIAIITDSVRADD